MLLNKKVLFNKSFLFLASLLNAAILLHFYNRYFALYDDGYYIHAAERLLNGEILNRDVQSRHGGYVHFIHALAMSLFGRDLISIRYPLVFLSFLQSVLVFFLFLPFSRLAALTASIAITAFSFVQYPNPAANWYCLFLTLVLITLISKAPEKKWKYLTAGILFGLIFLLRQLTVVFLGMGLVSYWIYSGQEIASKKSRITLRAVVVLMAGIFLLYSVSRGQDFISFFWFTLWPLALLFHTFLNIRLSLKTFFSRLWLMLSGAIIALIPMLVYLGTHGALGTWVDDTMIRAGRCVSLPYPETVRSLRYAFYAAHGILSLKNFNFPAGFYWSILPCLCVVNGALVAFSLRRYKNKISPVHFLPWAAVFYAMVSDLLQIPLYLYFSVGLSLLGVLFQMLCFSRRAANMGMILTLLLAAAGLYFHAGQPGSRGIIGTLEGVRLALVKSPFPNASIQMGAEEAQNYARSVNLIKSESHSDDEIFVFPNNPELYFLSERKNPYRFSETMTALQSREDLDHFIQLFDQKPPRLVIYDAESKYNSRFSRLLFEHIEPMYTRINEDPYFSIYRLKNKPTQ